MTTKVNVGQGLFSRKLGTSRGRVVRPSGVPLALEGCDIAANPANDEG
jgi:hypothetical protein